LNKIVKIFIGRIWNKNILTSKLKAYIIAALQHVNKYMLIHIIKEITMFTVDTVVDHATKNTKTVLGYIPNEEVRSNLEILVDAQAAYTKTVMNTVTDLAKLAAENVTKFATEAQKDKK
jgi:hypothetical protein